MNHLEHLLAHGAEISLPSDNEGFTGRECPNSECEGYFKIVFGTGLEEPDTPCHCPYCGYVAEHDHFLTQDQIEYVESLAIHKFEEAVQNDLKSLEFEQKPLGPFGIGVSVKLEPGRRVPVHRYREEHLETDLVCGNCSLRYSVYGVFAFCPDCGQHNSLQILEKNLEVVEKMVDLSLRELELSESIVENALEDCVSAFDGFGREMARVNAHKALNPDKAKKISFQNLLAARTSVRDLFSIDLSSPLSDDSWADVVKLFQKRHLIAHKMGVVDQDYIKRSGDSGASAGRKVSLDAGEVRGCIETVRRLAEGLSRHL